jgi:hypothetical protein
MTALSMVNNAHQSAHDTALDDRNLVVEAIGRSWQRLLTQSERTPPRLRHHFLSYENEPAPRRGVRMLRRRG